MSEQEGMEQIRAEVVAVANRITTIAEEHGIELDEAFQSAGEDLLDYAS